MAPSWCQVGNDNILPTFAPATSHSFRDRMHTIIHETTVLYGDEFANFVKLSKIDFKKCFFGDYVVGSNFDVTFTF